MLNFKDPYEQLLNQPPEPRTRSEDNWTFPKTYNSYVWNSSQVPKPAEPALSFNLMRGSSRTMHDVVTPGFKGRSRKGQIVNSPMTQVTRKLTVLGEGGCGFKSLDTNPDPDVLTVHEIKGMILPLSITTEIAFDNAIQTYCGSLVSAAERSSAIGLASTEARGKIELPSFTGLASIGELRETLSYLRNPLKAGLKLANLLERDLKMLNTSTRKGSTISAIASLYLEFRYAVRPLIFEVQKAVDTITAINLALDPVRKTARARQIRASAKTESFETSNNGNPYTCLQDAKVELSIRTGFLYEVVDGMTSNGWWGMRPSDVPAAMWELTPLSFVYDWVGNVGDFISAITPVAGINHLASWTTIEQKSTLSLQGSNYRSAFASVQTTRNGVNSMVLESVVKTRSPSVNAPSLEWRGLDSLANDPLKLLDLIGIFKQKLDPLAKKHEAFEREVRRANALDSRLNRFDAYESKKNKARAFKRANPFF